MLSVSGATVYQPADGTNVPDYLLARDGTATDVRLLYGLAGDGRFSHLVRFDGRTDATPIALSRVLDACLDLAGVPSIGVVLVAETVGLVGAALRRSPAAPLDDGDFFAHPGVRRRLAFTAEPAFARSVALVAGVAARGRRRRRAAVRHAAADRRRLHRTPARRGVPVPRDQEGKDRPVRNRLRSVRNRPAAGRPAPAPRRPRRRGRRRERAGARRLLDQPDRGCPMSMTRTTPCCC